MAQIQNVRSLIAKLRQRAYEAKGANASVIVGFTQNYAIYVHENLEAHHPNGQAKFLEEPARTFAKRIGEIVASWLKKGKTMAESLLMAGLFLQREAQKVTPVDTGALKASAFTRLE